MMRKTVPVTMAGAAIALALIGAGSAQADPQPNPPTPQYPVPTWVTDDARQDLADIIQRAGQEAVRDPEHASENVSRIIEEVWPTTG